jgi:Na+/melibiose symporter-like transporter
MLDPRVFRHRGLAAGSMSICVQFFAFFGFTFISLQYMQLVRGDSPIVAAVSVLPLAATMMPVTRLTPSLVARAGARWVCGGGLVLMAVGLVILSRLDATSPYWLLLAGLIPLGAGMGAAMTPATSGITDALPVSQQGVGSALNDLSRELGGALGIAVIGSVLAASYRSHLQLPGLPPQVVDHARASLAVAARLGGSVRIEAGAAFVSGMHGALLCAAVAALLAAIGVVLLLGSPHQASEAGSSARTLSMTESRSSELSAASPTSRQVSGAAGLATPCATSLARSSTALTSIGPSPSSSLTIATHSSSVMPTPALGSDRPAYQGPR